MPCPVCGAPTAVGARFCHHCGRPLDAVAAGLQAGDRRVVSALFADLVGYTRLVEELDAEEVRRRVDAAFGLLAAAVVRFGGSLEKFIGDAVFAVFGSPTGHDDDAARACLCALDMQAALANAAANAAIADGGSPGSTEAEADLSLRLRIGIATGEVVAAYRELAAVRALALTGETITTAARLQQLADPGQILLDEATVGAAGPRLEFRPIGRRILRGQRHEVSVHALVGERRGARHPRFEVPLVGRADELERLRALLRRTAAQGTGGTAVLVGEAGVGKSRLLAEVEEDARAAGFGWVWADNVSYGSGQPYRSVRSMIDWIADEAGLDAGTLARRVLFGPDLDPADASRIAGAVAALARDANMGGWEAEAAYAPADPAEVADSLRLATDRFLRRLAEFQPRCLVVDDYHWADAASLPLFAETVRLSAELPIVVLVGTRPQRLPEWSALPQVTVFELRGLDVAATERLGGAVAGADLDDDAARWLHERTAGNALFVTEIVRALRASGGLRAVADGRVGIVREAASASLPLSLRALLGARIDALPLAQRASLEVASVIGMTFPEWLLRDLQGDTFQASTLHDLAGAGLVEAVDPAVDAGDRETAGRWQFRHPLFHDVTYRRLLTEQRRDLHARLADRLSLVEPALPASELARHLVAAGDMEGALPLLDRAASEAVALGAVVEAAGFWEAAADLAGPGEQAQRLRARAEEVRATLRREAGVPR